MVPPANRQVSVTSQAPPPASAAEPERTPRPPGPPTIASMPTSPAPAPRSAPESAPGYVPPPSPSIYAPPPGAPVVREPTVPIIPAQFRPADRYSGPTTVTGTYQPAVQFSYAPPAVPGRYAPPWAPLPPSARTRRGRWLPAVAAVVAILAFLGVGGAAAVAVSEGGRPGAVRGLAGPPNAPPGAVPGSGRDQALDALLSRRAAALAGRNAGAFLADVDRSDETFLKRQQMVFDNMTKLPLVDVRYKLNPSAGYDAEIPATIRDSYGNDVRAAAVTVSYRIEGVDDRTVAVPWVPIFAMASGQWRLVGEATGKSLPSGVGGQPWDAGPIVVDRSDRVVGVFSANYRDRARLMRLAEQALDRVARVRSGNWVGKVFVVAVTDRTVFDAYFGATPERVDQVAAIAVPHYNDVHEWVNSAEYSATRIIFNPDELEEANQQLADDLTHEFTHAAMAPVTTGWTPTWLVEGLAEYVSYKGASIVESRLRQALRGVATDDLYAGDKFYDEPMNYITAWLACRMIAEKYTETKLIALYEKFQNTSVEDTVVQEVLGISRAQLVKDWQDYVAKQRN